MHSPTLARAPRLAPTPSAPSIAASPRPHHHHHPPASPPSAAIKKRKPRSASLILAANQRLCTAGKPAALPVPPPASSSPPAAPAAPAAPVAPAAPAAPAPLSPPLQLPNRPSLYHVAHASVASGANSFRPRAPGRRSARYSDAKRKGLRHFAIRVSNKVEQKRVTTYNQVADELVAEERVLRSAHSHSHSHAPAPHGLVDEKNIRRRVYDSLNVLMAMRIIAKDKKLITWQGLDRVHCSPHAERISAVKASIAQARSRLAQKHALLTELTHQHTRTCTIVERNRTATCSDNHPQPPRPQPPVPVHQQYPDRIGIPFFILSAPKETNIELEMDQSRQDICFTFNSSFAIFDDREVMRRMLQSPSSQLTSPQTVPVDPCQSISFSP